MPTYALDVVRMLRRECARQGYLPPRERHGELFVFAVRGDDGPAVPWSDVLGAVAWSAGVWDVWLWPGTTAPCREASLSAAPVADDETRTLVPGQYRGLWQVGRDPRGGPARLLVQQREALVWRGRWPEQAPVDPVEAGCEGAGPPDGVAALAAAARAGTQCWRDGSDFETVLALAGRPEGRVLVDYTLFSLEPALARPGSPALEALLFARPVDAVA